MGLNLPVKRIVTLALALLCFLSWAALADDKPCRVYFVGNIVTDTIRYDSLAKLSRSRVHALTWGRGHDPWRSVVLALGTSKGWFSAGAVWALSQGSCPARLTT
jgi:hypothetical protein